MLTYKPFGELLNNLVGIVSDQAERKLESNPPRPRASLHLFVFFWAGIPQIHRTLKTSNMLLGKFFDAVSQLNNHIFLMVVHLIYLRPNDDIIIIRNLSPCRIVQMNIEDIVI